MPASSLAESSNESLAAFDIHQGPRFDRHFFRMIQAMPEVVLERLENDSPAFQDLFVCGKNGAGKIEPFSAAGIEAGRGKRCGDLAGGLDHLLINILHPASGGIKGPVRPGYPP